MSDNERIEYVFQATIVVIGLDTETPAEALEEYLANVDVRQSFTLVSTEVLP